MGKINLARVFLGGLLAGLILNIFEYVLNGVVFASQWDAYMKALGRQMRPNAIPFFIISAFVAGIGVVWLYAVARPRLGAGPKTAALTGAAYWFFAYAIPDANSIAANVVPGRVTLTISLILLVAVIIASVCGAWLYKEQT
ncbi:MAG TPA: hypothetical protein VJK29_21015 [Terriglobales bacterium]|nr:hypothetical protein [Terriglobales bacterium]